MGNLRSVQKALQKVGADAQIASTISDIASAEKIVLPGVGAFGEGMARLKERRFVEPLLKAVRDGVPFLGICLGLQLLFDVSHEEGQHTGLGVCPGKVVRFHFPPDLVSQRLPVPHMGWNQIRITSESPLLRGIDDGEYFYFAHSYYVTPIDGHVTAAVTNYGYEFTSSVWRGTVFGVQFHPEKSQDAGLKLLSNFVEL